jgi:hypothetical protein
MYERSVGVSEPDEVVPSVLYLISEASSVCRQANPQRPATAWCLGHCITAWAWSPARISRSSSRDSVAPAAMTIARS